MGRYNLDPDSLPHGKHMPGATQFKEAENTKQLEMLMSVLGNGLAILIFVCLVWRYGFDDVFFGWTFWGPFLLSFPSLFVHELIHAVCFRGDVYMYTNLRQMMLFVVGPEHMTKSRFVFMSLLPAALLGLGALTAGLAADMPAIAVYGALNLSSGVGDFYNVFNAVTQMPKGAMTYLYGFHSFWFMPEEATEHANEYDFE